MAVEKDRPEKSEGELRGDFGACLQAAIEAVHPEHLVRDAACAIRETLQAGPRPLLLGFGKATAPMARGAIDGLRPPEPGAGAAAVAGGVLVIPSLGAEFSVDGLGGCERSVQVFRGGHPLPDEGSVRGARAILEASRTAATDQRPVIVLISGGGSALLTLPAPGLSLDDVRSVTHALLNRGANIEALNCVRKHLDQLKGGQLARHLYPAPVVGFVLSDVIGDSLGTIASGPLTADCTSFAEATEALHTFDVWEAAPEAVRDHLSRGVAGEIEETPTLGTACFQNVDLQIVGSAATAAQAARDRAEGLGYHGEVVTCELQGEAREVGRHLGREALRARERLATGDQPLCLIYAGETTVTVEGSGLGGRNQELALAAALELEACEGVLLGSFGTDGVDGPTDAAGAIATGSTLARARQLGLSPDAHLEVNDSFAFFAALGDHVRTGPTETNVMDLQILLISP